MITHANDRKPSSGELRDVSRNDSSRDGSTVSDDGRDGRLVRREALSRLEVGRVQILRSVRKEVEAGHEEHGVDASEPVLPEHGPKLSHEGLRRVLLLGLASLDGRLLLGSGLEKLGGLWEKGSEDGGGWWKEEYKEQSEEISDGLDAFLLLVELRALTERETRSNPEEHSPSVLVVLNKGEGDTGGEEVSAGEKGD